MCKYRIGTSEVSRLMCTKRLMGDGCFNNFEDKNISSPYTHFCVLLGHMGLHRSTELHENCYFFYKINTIVSNNVHLQHQKASVILWTKTCHLNKEIVLFYVIWASIWKLWNAWKFLLNKSETQNCSIMSIYSTIKLVFFTLGPRNTRFLNDEFKF